MTFVLIAPIIAQTKIEMLEKTGSICFGKLGNMGTKYGATHSMFTQGSLCNAKHKEL